MIYAQMATIPGREASRQVAIESLRDQVDCLSVVFNGDFDFPCFNWMEADENLFHVYPHEARQHPSDGWKFYQLSKLAVECYILIVDDDIEYPPDFALKMVEAVERYSRMSVVTCMGKIMKPRPIKSFYRDELLGFKTFETNESDVTCEIPGTCATAYHSSTCPELDHTYFKSPNSDIWMGKYCRENQILPVVIRHNGEWLKNLTHLNPPGTYSIFDRFKNDDKEMTDLVNSFL